MENKDAFLKNIFLKWNMNINGIDDYINRYTEQSLIIDIFPYRITNEEKNYQVEVFYKRYRDKEIKKKDFLNYENRYLDFVKLLWLYNDTDIFYELYLNNYFCKGIKKI